MRFVLIGRITARRVGQFRQHSLTGIFGTGFPGSGGVRDSFGKIVARIIQQRKLQIERLVCRLPVIVPPKVNTCRSLKREGFVLPIILSDGSSYKVTEVYHKSQDNDFIIFKVGVSRKVNYIKIANNTPKVGEKIYTIGSPRGLDNTFSSGEISQIRENGKILQISAPIDHGSSGGVLLNSKGEAVGITSGGIDDSGANLNYAWNIQLIKSYIP